MVVIYMTDRQLIQGPEIRSIKVVNNIFFTYNIYIINSQAIFVITYNKAQKQYDKTEYILCYLPDTISQILVKYLIYILLFSYVIK